MLESTKRQAQTRWRPCLAHPVAASSGNLGDERLQNKRAHCILSLPLHIQMVVLLPLNRSGAGNRESAEFSRQENRTAWIGVRKLAPYPPFHDLYKGVTFAFHIGTGHLAGGHPFQAYKIRILLACQFISNLCRSMSYRDVVVFSEMAPICQPLRGLPALRCLSQCQSRQA